MVSRPPLKSPWDHPPKQIGRYLLYGELAAGGMATVHMGRLTGPVGFSRTVAIKQLHPQFAKDQSFVEMFLDEARLAARIRHPNVVSTLDVVTVEDQLYLIMDYVHGESLGHLIRAAADGGVRIPPKIASAIVLDALLGLHAAHEATDDRGRALMIVHRDVSPQNILIGVDGVARVADFGVAKAASRVHTTQGGDVKGKISYMSPEQLQNGDLDRRTDLFAAAIVLWEALVGRRLFAGNDIGTSVTRILSMKPDAPSKWAADVPPALDALVLKGLAKGRDERFSTAREMAQALEIAMPPAGSLEVGAWVEAWASEKLDLRSERAQLRTSNPPEATMRFATNEGTVRIQTSTTIVTPAGQDVTGISLATGTPPLPKPRRKAGLIVGGATLAIAALGIGITSIWGGARAPTSTERANAGGHPSGTTPTSSATARMPDTSKTAVPADSLPHIEATAMPESEVLKPKVSGNTVRTTTSATAVQVSKAPKRSCNPPYILNPDGTKRFKTECF